MKQITFDPLTSRYRGAKGHFLRESELPRLAFLCRFCRRLRPLAEMRMLTRLFPLLPACSECDKTLG